MQTKAIYHIFGKTEGVQFCTKVLLFVELFLFVLFFWWFCVWDYHYPLQHQQFFRFRWYTWIEQEQSIKIIDELTRTNKEQGAQIHYISGKIFHGKGLEFWRHMLCKQKTSRRLRCSLSVSNLVNHLLLNRLFSQFFFESR